MQQSTSCWLGAMEKKKGLDFQHQNIMKGQTRDEGGGRRDEQNPPRIDMYEDSEMVCILLGLLICSVSRKIYDKDEPAYITRFPGSWDL